MRSLFSPPPTRLDVGIDMRRDQFRKGAHEVEVALVERSVRAEVEAAEGAVNPPVGEAQWSTEIGADRYRAGDRYCHRLRDGGRVGNQLGQLPLDDFRTVAVIEGMEPPGLTGESRLAATWRK